MTVLLAVRTFFEVLFNLAMTALPVMAAVIAARWVLEKCRAPKKIAYALWTVVGFRLCCPVTLSSAVSIFNAVQPVADATSAVSVGRGALSAVQFGGGMISRQTQLAPGSEAIPLYTDVVPAASQVLTPAALALRIAAVIWLAGLAAIVVYSVVSYLRLRRRMAAAVLLEDGVFAAEGIATPFVLGFLRPKIYMPSAMEEFERAHVLLHERTHLRRGDPWWKLLGFGILAVYWWNPAAWLCWVLFCRDMEMSCDEAVLRALGPEVKRAYSLSLVSFAAGRRFPAANPLAFGESDAKSRVKNVLKWKQARFGVAFLAVCLCLGVAAVCCTNAQNKSWVKLEQPKNGPGVAFTCDLLEPIQSWVIYEDVYENGQLISSEARIMDGFLEDGTGVVSRKFSSELTYETVSDADSGFAGTLNCAAMGASWGIALPKDHYTGCASFFGTAGVEDGSAKRCTIAAGGEQLLLSVCFSTDAGGALYTEPLKNDAVVQFRLVTYGGGSLAYSTGKLDGTAGGTVAYTCRTGAETQYVNFYEDVYQNGELLSSEFRLSGGIAGEDRKDSVSLTLSPRENLDWSLRYGGAATSWTTALNDTSCSGRTVEYLTGEQILTGTDNLVLAAVYQERATGPVEVYPAPCETVLQELDSVIASNDTVVLIRMETSQTAPSASLAQTLYSLKTPYVGDMPADGKILSALGVQSELGRYTMELSTSKEPYALQVNFADEPGDTDPTSPSVDRAMRGNAAILLALIDNLGQVNWTYPSGEDGQTMLMAVAFTREDADVWAQSAGYADVRTMGRSTKGIAALLTYLSGGLSANTAAQTLYDLRLQDPSDSDAFSGLVHGVGIADKWGVWMLTARTTVPTGTKVPELHFTTAIPEAREDAFNEEMRKNACLLLALCAGAERVNWAYQTADENGELTSGSFGGHFTSDDARMYLENLSPDTAGDTLPVKSYGASPEQLGVLLDCLDFGDAGASDAAEPFADILGFDGVIRETTDATGFITRDYVAVIDGAETVIAESFGWEPEEWAVDLDGDGVRELVCNVTYGADGFRAAYVYRRQGNEIQRGSLTTGDLPSDYLDWGINSTWSEYDGAEKVFRQHYALTGQDDYAVRETTGYDHMEFFNFSR